MSWKIEAASLRARDICEIEVGTVFVFSDQMARELVPVLLLADDQSQFRAIELAGKESFVLRAGGVKVPGHVSVIPLFSGELEVELPAAARSDGGRMEMRGSLVISPIGAFMTIQQTQNGFPRAGYVSLSDWTIVDRPGHPATTFSKWRLNVANKSDRLCRSIIEIGDWGEQA